MRSNWHGSLTSARAFSRCRRSPCSAIDWRPSARTPRPSRSVLALPWHLRLLPLPRAPAERVTPMPLEAPVTAPSSRRGVEKAHRSRPLHGRLSCFEPSPPDRSPACTFTTADLAIFRPHGARPSSNMKLTALARLPHVRVDSRPAQHGSPVRARAHDSGFDVSCKTA